MSSNKQIKVVTRASDGSLRIKDFEGFDQIAAIHNQVGIDDCSTDLTLRGMTLFRLLIGPLSEVNSVVLYESPEVFEALTKEWSQTKTKRRRRKAKPAAGTVPIPNVPMAPVMASPLGFETIVS